MTAAPVSAAAAPVAFVILTGADLGKGYRSVDQICGSKAEANREARDLREMGESVSVKAFTSWADAEAFADKIAAE